MEKLVKLGATFVTKKYHHWRENKTPPSEESQISPQIEMRIGRVEREAVVKTLNEAYLEDKIFPHEHDERIEKALQATTQEELNSIIRDLVIIAPPPLKPSVFSVEKVEEPPPSTVRKAYDLPREGFSLSEFFLTLFIVLTLTAFILTFLTNNDSGNFSKLENHISDVSAILTDEVLRTNEPLTLVAGEGLDIIRTANNEPLPSSKSEEIDHSRAQAPPFRAG